MTDRYSYFRREFLNVEGRNSLAGILATIQAPLKPGITWIDANINLSDCFRSITLEFDAYSREDKDAAIHKLDLLIEVLQDFREMYTSQAENTYWEK